MTTLQVSPTRWRIAGAVLSAVVGIATGAVLLAVPAGLGADRPGGVVALVLSAPELWTSLAYAGSAVALLLVIAAEWQTRSRRIDRAAAVWLVEPLLWGCGLPVLATLLDPWFFHRSVAILGAAGLGLGLIGSAARARQLPPSRPAPVSRTMALLIAGAIVVPTALLLPGPPWFQHISGDEPHYLTIARSIWVDGDLDLANDYGDGLLAPFWSDELAPHAKPGVDRDKLYSIHGIGLPIWLTPWYAAGRGLTESGFNILVRVAMTLWLAAAAACLFVLLSDIAGRRAATRGTAVAIFTMPLIFAGPHLFPAVPVFTLSCAAYLIIRRRPGPAGALASGLMLACLPWLHFKFFGVMAAISIVGALELRRRQPGPGRSLALAMLLGPVVISGMGHAGFTWLLYERLSPLAIGVGADPNLRAPVLGDDWGGYLSDPVGIVRTALGYFLDQREGLLFYAPQYLLAAAGFAWLLRRRRRDALALGLILVALVSPYALSQEIGRWAPPARPLSGVLWTLAVPMGIALSLPAGGGARGRWRSATRGALLAWGVGITLLLLPQTALLYHDFNVRFALVLMRYGAPGLPLKDVAPLLLGAGAPHWLPSLFWLVVAAALAVFLWRWGSSAAAMKSDSVEATETPAAAGLGPQADDDTPTIRAPLGEGYAAAAWMLVAASVFLLWRQARVPVTDLHVASTFGMISYWTPQSPRARAWPDEGGIWTGGFDSVELLLSSPEPVEVIVFDVDVLTPMRVTMQVGADRRSFAARPGAMNYARFVPGSATRWKGEYYYHLIVDAPLGASLAGLGIKRDIRNLGVFLEVVQVESGGGAPSP